MEKSSQEDFFVQIWQLRMRCLIYTEQYTIAQGDEHYEISEEFKAILEENGLQLDDVRNMTYSDLQAF